MTKEIGSTWMFYPKAAGYENVWQPGMAKIVEVFPEPIRKGNAPIRQYVVERDGGVRLFANDLSLTAIPG